MNPTPLVPGTVTLSELGPALTAFVTAVQRAVGPRVLVISNSVSAVVLSHTKVTPPLDAEVRSQTGVPMSREPEFCALAAPVMPSPKVQVSDGSGDVGRRGHDGEGRRPPIAP